MLGKYGCVVVANGLFPSGKLALQALGVRSVWWLVTGL